jgi:hypothetical protein
MSKFCDGVVATVLIGALTTAIAQAQQVFTLPLESQPVPAATPLTTPKAMPEAKTAATERLIPRSQMAWHAACPFGIEKLPDFSDKNFSVFGSAWYPQFGAGQYLQSGFYEYQASIEARPNNRPNPFFVEVGYTGDSAYSRLFAPANISDRSIFAAFGLHF